MERNLIALAIPVFFAMIAVEFFISLLMKRRVYRLNDTLNDLACGILQQTTAVFTGVLLLGLYAWTWEHFRVTDAWTTGSTAAWVLCFIGVDFLYYWFHRFSHESAVGWAVHVVHHQSEEYNLAVALRQDAFQPFISTLFYIPLAVAGFPPVMFATCAAVNTLYQFWIHTRLVGKLGPLEWLFNTPSHHRVHHGTEQVVLDKNYAGVFITWDMLFRSFHREGDEPRYGIIDPVRSWNPLYAHVQYPLALWRKALSMPSLADGVRAIFKSPGWFPGRDEPTEVALKVAEHQRSTPYNVDAPPAFKPYALANFVVATELVTWLLFHQYTLPTPVKALAALHIVLALVGIGALFDRPSWLRGFESARHVYSLAVAALAASGAPSAAAWSLVIAAIILASWWQAISSEAVPATT